MKMFQDYELRLDREFRSTNRNSRRSVIRTRHFHLKKKKKTSHNSFFFNETQCDCPQKFRFYTQSV